MSNKNNRKKQPVVKGFEWEVGQIMNANLMFPTQQFESIEALKALTDEEFSEQMIQLLSPVQPLDNFERAGLAQSVNSGDRLRVYYHTLRVIERRLAAANDTETLGCEGAKLSHLIDGHGIQVKEEGQLDYIDEEFPDEAIAGESQSSVII